MNPVQKSCPEPFAELRMPGPAGRSELKTLKIKIL